jgi:maltose O-acetyltransferase
MLSDFLYLWRNREKPNDFKRWAVVWVKRLLLAFPLLRLFSRVMFLRIRGAQLGRLVVIGRVKFQGSFRNLQIGECSSLGRCEIVFHDKVSIGRRVVINDGAILLTASHSLSDPKWRQKKAPITVHDYAWVATNAIVLPGVSIGTGAVVGAGAVLRTNVPPYSLATGNPAIIQSVSRARALAYTPALLNSPIEAWIGRNLDTLNIGEGQG